MALRDYNAAAMPSEEPRSGRCAIVGRPNVGKSTLLNAVLGQKLAIATDRPQTTRTCLLGVYISDEPPTQIAFIDTPGLHRPKNALGRALVENAKGGLADADVVLMMIEINRKRRLEELLVGEEGDILAMVKTSGLPVVLAINKIDKLPNREALFPVLEHCNARYDFAGLVPMSASRKQNVKGVIRELRNHLPEGLSLDPDVLTDKPERFFASELVREALMEATHQEIPYSVAVTIDEFVDEPEITRISATIVVPRESHKGIVIGKGGSMLKNVGSTARAEIEALLQRKVFLKLWVKVVEDWTDNPRRIRDLTGNQEES